MEIFLGEEGDGVGHAAYPVLELFWGWVPGTAMCYQRDNDGNYASGYPSAPVAWDGGWHHIAATSDGTNLTVYADGVAGTPLPLAYGAFDMNYGFAFGIAANWQYATDEKIALARAYTRCLTADEILNNYNCGINARVGLAYNLRGRALKTLAPVFNLIGLVKKTLAPSYRILTWVRKTLSPAYYILTRAAVKTIAALYNIRNLAKKTVAGTYNIFGKALKTLAATFNLRGKALKTIAGTFGILGWVRKTISATYGLYNLARKTLSGAFGILGRVSKTLAPSYRIWGLVRKATAYSFNVLTRVVQTLTAAFSILLPMAWRGVGETTVSTITSVDSSGIIETLPIQEAEQAALATETIPLSTPDLVENQVTHMGIETPNGTENPVQQGGATNVSDS
jgi:hypothetical protein